MNDAGHDILAAEADLERAKARFFNTLGALERRFSPQEFVGHAGGAIWAKLSAFGRSEIVQARPTILMAGAAALAALIASRPISRALKRKSSSD